MVDEEIIEQINTLKKEFDSLLPMNEQQQKLLDKKLALEFHYNSNHIEGNTLTYGETELLLLFEETRGNHSLREYEEMTASDVALNLVEDEAIAKDKPLTEAFIKNLNKILLIKPYWKEAITADGQNIRRKILVGEYKKQPNSVRLGNGEIFEYASPAETPILMGELMSWYQAEVEKSSIHPVVLAAQLHYKFVRIHPFDDGNGRISRLLMNYVLFYYNFPPVIIKSSDKSNYLKSLHDADVGMEESFNNYIAEKLIWSLQLSINAAKGEPVEEKEDWKKKASLLKKKLESHEPVKITKSLDVIIGLINNKIINFLYACLDNINDYDDLFLDKFVSRNSIDPHKANVILKKGESINPETIKTYFSNQIILHLVFSEFTKNINDPFSVEESLTFVFKRHKYDIIIKEQVVFSKLYHQEFLNNEVEELCNIIGSFVYEQIEVKLADVNN